MSSELETVAVNSGLGSDLFVHFVSRYTYWIINYFYFILFIDINGGLYIHCFFTPHLVLLAMSPLMISILPIYIHLEHIALFSFLICQKYNFFILPIHLQ